MIKKIMKIYGMRKLNVLAFDLLSLILSQILVIYILSYYYDKYFTDYLTIYNILFYSATIINSIFLFRYYKLYKQKIFTTKLVQLHIIFKVLLISFFPIIIFYLLLFSDSQFAIPIVNLVQYYFLSFAIIIFSRLWLLKNIRRILGKSNIYKRKILIIGAGRNGQKLASIINKKYRYDYQITGFLDDDESLLNKSIDNITCLGNTDEIYTYSYQKDIDELFISINTIDYGRILELIKKCKRANCQINILTEQFSIITKKFSENEVDSINYLRFSNKINGLYKTFFKRMLDVIISLILMTILSPLLVIFIILIKLTSKGPAFFSPLTVGYKGKQFKFHKLRSMYYNVSNSNHKKLVNDFMNGKIVGAKLRDDERVTKIGKFIRKYSLDELAQLFNVFKGNMSLVGPRPSTIYEYELMKDWQKQRYNVLPGMTGLWQTYGRAEVSFIDMIIMDLYYIENCSLWLDIIILFKTVGVVLRGKGGY